MKLSIVIVNYNVKFFLEQALVSVRNALKNLDAEVFVVDNNSADGSCEMVKQLFPEVILIENKENLGFSKANNQAIKLAKGEYILLLNPDTLVDEKTFLKTIAFMDANPNAGGLGVKMVDGKGAFLPESKRGLPTPEVAFYKMSGLAKLFPKSKKLGQYYLSYLPENEIAKIEVLAGAFMLLRAETLAKCGLLDEAFFMYGEDIDLSYRITLAGYANYYFPETTIIHYKGESTKKGSLNYVKVFYNAMIIFAQKHFNSKISGQYISLIKLAIYVTAAFSAFKRLLGKLILPIFDILLIGTGFITVSNLWATVKYHNPNHFQQEILLEIVPFFALIWILTLWISGIYKTKYTLAKLIKTLLAGGGLVLICYSLLPENLRFSRAVILFSTFWALVLLPLYRVLFQQVGLSVNMITKNKQKTVIIAGTSEESKRVVKILENLETTFTVLGRVGNVENNCELPLLSNFENLSEVYRINKPDEIIFCLNDLNSSEIIKTIVLMASESVSFKIAAHNSIGIIGSNSSTESGELYVPSVNSVLSETNLAAKRSFDITMSILLLLFFPFFFFIFQHKKIFLTNCFFVLSGRKTWVSIGQNDNFANRIKPGILYYDTEPAKQNNYLRNYAIWLDFRTLVTNFKYTDNQQTQHNG